MNYVYVCEVELEQFKEGAQPNVYRFVFANQPDAEDVLEAFDNDVFISKLSYRSEDRKRLVRGLNTYGVPAFDAMDLVDHENYSVGTPLVFSIWGMNAVSRYESRLAMRYGSITVQLKPLIENENRRPAARGAVVVLDKDEDKPLKKSRAPKGKSQ